ncbi:PaaI family thioesterase [Nocardia sp. NPDC005745]|uniref:PaaI family thioesterase n=1 Tax=Nocardia sp. NPDC005745 TaxID=3157061 RepID=UPI0033E530BF
MATLFNDPNKGHVVSKMANEQLNSGFGQVLGLNYSEISQDRVAAEFMITPVLHQPDGIVHGGVYSAVVEALASVGGSEWYGSKGRVVGVNNNTDFLRQVSAGTLYAEATPIHRGRSQQLWSVMVMDSEGRLVAHGQVRLANLAESMRAD